MKLALAFLAGAAAMWLGLSYLAWRWMDCREEPVPC